MKVALAAMSALLIVLLGAAAPSPTPDSPTPGAAASPCEQGPKPASLNDWVRRGDCLRDAQELDAALEACQSGLAAFPAGSRDLYISLGLTYSEMHRPFDELAAFESALKFDAADPEALYFVGIGYEEIFAYPTALEYFHKVLATRPNDGRAHRNIGYVLLQQGKREDAIGPLQTALEIDPGDWKANLNLGAAYGAICSAIDQELSGFVPAERSAGDPNSPPIRRRTELLEKRKRFDCANQATKHDREAARLHPEDARTWYNLGTGLMRNPGNSVEAIDALQ